MTRRRLRRGVFHSLVDLQAAINRYLAEHNANPKPFVWTATPESNHRQAAASECVSALAIDLAWKPTRQVRGCVVYPAEQIAGLNAMLVQARKDKPGQSSAPAAVRRELLATPLGLFSLLQTWSTTDRCDYALLPLLTTAQPLSTGNSKGGDWYLTPNGNQTSGAIAAAAVGAGMKTLVFVQTTVFRESCVANFSARLNTRPVGC